MQHKNKIKLNSFDKGRWQFISRVAASFIFLITITFISINGKNWLHEIQWLTAKEIIVNPGKMSKITLPDGSFVWLNAGSSLEYPMWFLTDSRTVKLKGEGYFEVNHRKNKSFIVSTPFLQIKVLGTSFNVQAHPSSSQVDVLVTKGKVNIEKNIHGEPKMLTMLTANDRLTYFEETKQWNTTKVNPEYLPDWRKGHLYFNDQKLKDIAKILEYRFDQPIIIDHAEVENYTFTASFTQASLYSILDALKNVNKFEYKIESDTIRIKCYSCSPEM